MKKITPYIFSIVIMTSCAQNNEKQEIHKEYVQVRTCKPLQISYTDPLRSSGILVTSKEMKLSFKTGGFVKMVHVNEGQKVKKGDVLASLDLEEINATLQQANIAFEKSKRDYTRAQNLYKDTVATLELVQNAKSAYELAKAQKNIVEFNLKHSRIVAPSDGRIQKILVEKNEIVGPGYPVILFASTDNDWVVRVSLSDKDIVKFTYGDSAVIELDAFPTKKFNAIITELGSFADPVTGTYEVELQVKDADLEFRTGFIARAIIFPSESKQGLWVPFEAVHDLRENTGFIYKVTDSTSVKKREIRTGNVINDGIIIEEGIKATDLIVIEGAANLKSDVQIKVINSEKGK